MSNGFFRDAIFNCTKMLSISVLENERQSQIIGQRNFLRHEFAKNNTFPLDHYWNYDEIDQYIEYLLKNHANLVEAERIGYSYEGREMRAIKISLHGKVDGSRPIIFIDAGTHAREWASHMTAVHLMHQLIERHDQHDWLQHVDWIVVPIVNPDGFVYSHTTVINRTIHMHILRQRSFEVPIEL